MAAPEAQQSRLLALPRELRDEIYTLAFESTEVDLAWSGYEHRNNGIILASKQTYEETIDLYYKHTPFLAFFDRTLALWLINLPFSSREKTWRAQNFPRATRLSLAGVLRGLSRHNGRNVRG